MVIEMFLMSSREGLRLLGGRLDVVRLLLHDRAGWRLSPVSWSSAHGGMKCESIAVKYGLAAEFCGSTAVNRRTKPREIRTRPWKSWVNAD